MSEYKLSLTAEQINDLLNKLHAYQGNLSLPTNKYVSIDTSAYSADKNNSIKYTVPADGRLIYQHTSGTSAGAFSSATFHLNGVAVDGWSHVVHGPADVLNFAKDLPAGTEVIIWGSATGSSFLQFNYARSSAPEA